jgi:hypothetical protein
MKTQLRDLTKGDVISIKYGFDFKKAIVVGNNGQYISWNFDFNGLSEDTFKSEPYTEIESYYWSHIGIIKRGFFTNKIELF